MTRRIRDVLALLTSGPVDTSTESGRARERQRRVLLAMTSSGAARAISMATGLVAVPLTLKYLGSERYGLWMVISSLAMALNFADLGLGNGLVNTLADAYGRNDRAAARRQVSTAFFLFSAIAVTLLLGCWMAFPSIDWARQFNVHSTEAMAEVGPSLWYFAFSIILGLVLSIVVRVELAYQNAFANSLWQAAGSVGSLAALLVAMRFHAGLPTLVLMLSGVPVLATACQAVRVFFFTRPWLRPSFSMADRGAAAQLMTLGVGYLVLQVATTLTVYSDNLITTKIFGPETVTQYSVVAKPFALAMATLFMALVPMWPAYTEALAKGDLGWVRRTLNRSIGLVVLLVGVPSMMLILIGGPLIRWWVRSPSFEVPVALLLAIGVWTVIQGIGSAWATLMNGLGIVRFQAVCALVTALAAVGAKIFFARQSGIVGLVWGTSLAYVLFTLVPVGLYMRHTLARRAVAA